MHESALHPNETRFVARAIAKRRREFAGGHLCARHALVELNIWDYPLLVGEDRFPIWPETVVGSITHTDGYSGAVVTPVASYYGTGVDVELRRRLETKLDKEICTGAELLCPPCQRL